MDEKRIDRSFKVPPCRPMVCVRSNTMAGWTTGCCKTRTRKLSANALKVKRETGEVASRGLIFAVLRDRQGEID